MVTQTTVSRAVKNYMKREKLTQLELAALLETSQKAISRKLRNEARWNVNDLDRLTVLGVIEPVTALDVTDWTNHD